MSDQGRLGRIGRRLRAADPFPARGLTSRRLVEAGVTLAPRLVDASDTTTVFADGQRERVDAVIWATGYRDETAWVRIGAAIGADGGFVETRGVSPVPGLCFVGRPWQSGRASALLTGVGRDANGVIDAILRHRTWPSIPSRTETADWRA